MKNFLIEKKKFPQTSTNSRQNSGEKQITRIMSLKHSKLITPNSAEARSKPNETLLAFLWSLKYVYSFIVLPPIQHLS